VKVTDELDRVIAQRGRPLMMTCDNGTEFTSNHFDAWTHQCGVALDVIRPGRPVSVTRGRCPRPSRRAIDSEFSTLRVTCVRTTRIPPVNRAIPTGRR
jgi:hypothetical protein